ncbi:hypothetical protein SARC_09598 [Sphaeroforma arctica JP610]|uniref:Uncharacterized protein n=1 Tax=Sphaeroforma arctica JP610 TaxID=667725 RepID=A0A0L0FMH0_9EUKA|nr:hypothetical protein SARC_09598 [Sphaeroforma arctica JP610]KNC77955.1 hypothetical protein SARC_09598 [Sphaeroforma arctica JP610]|eukprot:XP_014151857.1 hypothetical protein SARC_09598 [Sphaeroforma arctica JP610]
MSSTDKHMEVFWDFISTADGHRFNAHVVTCVLRRITTLTDQLTARDSVATEDFEELWLKLQALGTCLGVATFYPFWTLDVAQLSDMKSHIQHLLHRVWCHVEMSSSHPDRTTVSWVTPYLQQMVKMDSNPHSLSANGNAPRQNKMPMSNHMHLMLKDSPLLKTMVRLYRTRAVSDASLANAGLVFLSVDQLLQSFGVTVRDVEGADFSNACDENTSEATTTDKQHSLELPPDTDRMLTNVCPLLLSVRVVLYEAKYSSNEASVRISARPTVHVTPLCVSGAGVSVYMRAEGPGSPYMGTHTALHSPPNTNSQTQTRTQVLAHPSIHGQSVIGHDRVPLGMSSQTDTRAPTLSPVPLTTRADPQQPQPQPQQHTHTHAQAHALQPTAVSLPLTNGVLSTHSGASLSASVAHASPQPSAHDRLSKGTNTSQRHAHVTTHTPTQPTTAHSRQTNGPPHSHTDEYETELQYWFFQANPRLLHLSEFVREHLVPRTVARVRDELIPLAVHMLTASDAFREIIRLAVAEYTNQRTNATATVATVDAKTADDIRITSGQGIQASDRDSRAFAADGDTSRQYSSERNATHPDGPELTHTHGNIKTSEKARKAALRLMEKHHAEFLGMR